MIISGRQSDRTMPTMFLSDKLIAEILSYLNVKTILRFKCVSKSWNNFISDSNFVEKHLKSSSQNSYLTLVWYQSIHIPPGCYMPHNVLPFPVHGILKNPSINVLSNKNYFRRYPLEFRCKLVGSCNGLLCLLFNSDYWTKPVESWFRFYNPATREKSNKLGSIYLDQWDRFKYTFGYDALTKTYKVVAFLVEKVNQPSWKSEVKIFNLGDNCWRNIQSFPLVPLDSLDEYHYKDLGNGVHLSGTVNWIAMDNSITHVQQFVIISLDLSTETYNQFLLPSDFDNVSFSQPALRVLTDCLCFSHDSKKLEFILWQMKEYGVRESWTQLLKISYQNLEMHLPKDNFDSDFHLACLYVNGDKAIFANKRTQYHNQAFIYNLKDKRIKIIYTRVNCIRWFDLAMDYVESLVSICWE